MANAPSKQNLVEIDRAALVSNIKNEDASALKILAAAQDKILTLELDKNASRLAMRALLTPGQGYFAPTKERLQKLAKGLDYTTQNSTPKAPTKDNDVTSSPTQKRPS